MLRQIQRQLRLLRPGWRFRPSSRNADRSHILIDDILQQPPCCSLTTSRPRPSERLSSWSESTRPCYRPKHCPSRCCTRGPWQPQPMPAHLGVVSGQQQDGHRRPRRFCCCVSCDRSPRALQLTLEEQRHLHDLGIHLFTAARALTRTSPTRLAAGDGSRFPAQQC